MDVHPFVVAAYIVGFARNAFVPDGVHGAYVIAYKQPVADVFAFAIYRDGFLIDDLADDYGNELFGILVRAVVIRAVANNHWQAIGFMVSPYKVVA